MDKDEAVISDKPPKLCNCDFGECDFSDENDDATVPEGWKPEADQKDIIITEGWKKSPLKNMSGEGPVPSSDYQDIDIDNTKNDETVPQGWKQHGWKKSPLESLSGERSIPSNSPESRYEYEEKEYDETQPKGWKVKEMPEYDPQNVTLSKGWKVNEGDEPSTKKVENDETIPEGWKSSEGKVPSTVENDTEEDVGAW